MNNITITNKSKLQECLSKNVHYTTSDSYLSATQIGDDFKVWKDMCKAVQPLAYAVGEAHQNHADPKEAMSALVNKMKEFLAVIGPMSLYDAEGNAHDAKVTIDDEFTNGLSFVCATYAGKEGKDEAPALQLARSQKRNAEKLLNEYSDVNGVDPATIEHLKNEVAEYDKKIKELLDTKDMSVPKFVPASEGAFRKNLENHIGRTLNRQKAKSWEEYQAEAEAKRKARRAKTAAKKAEKKAESK